MMSCKELVELVTDYLEDRLEPEVRVAFDEHLGLCPWCVHYLEQIKLLARVAPAAREPELTGLAEKLLPAFRDWTAARG